MSSAAIPKYTIALQHLERGIELYLRGDSYYSALHLAGAAEEIFKVYVRALPPAAGEAPRSASDQMQELFLELSSAISKSEREELSSWFHERTYTAKNSVKHKRGLTDHSVDFDPREEAEEMLELAVSTYFQLFARTNIPYVACIENFDRALKSRGRVG